jgi:hypothetical protein
VKYPKPKRSSSAVVGGVLIQLVGGVIVVFGAMSLSSSYYTGGPQATVIVGVIVSLIGWIWLLVGLGRAFAGIDYLVQVAPEPTAPSSTNAAADATLS